MNALSRYMLTQLLTATFLVAGILTVLVVLLRSLRLIDFVVNRGVSFGTLAEMTFYVAPPIFAQLLPIGLLVGVLFTYARLSAERELVVMRAAGMSQLALARPVLALALIVSAICYSITLYLGPLSQQVYRDMQMAARSGLAQVFLHEGRFNSPLDRVTVYVRSRAANGDLRGIIVHDARDPGRPVTWMAETGVVLMTPAGPQVEMFNGNRQEVGGADNELTLVYFERGAIDLAALDPGLAERQAAGGERFLGQLFDPEPEAAHRRNVLFVEGLRRISTPLLPFGLGLIAAAALLTGDHNRRGQMWRILSAIAAATLVQLIDSATGSLATQTPVFRPLVFLAPLAAIALGAWWLLRQPRRYIRRLRHALAPAAS
jgi:lipopolysaccharide export system permease protein